MTARLGWLAAGEAVVELAEAAGLRLVPPGALDAMRATTFGVGELLRAALDGGARRIVVGVGGSASTDGGAGMLAALGARLLDASGADLPAGGGALSRLAQLDLSGLDVRLRDCHIEVAVDVRSPLLGPHGAAAVFGPQKGASPADVTALDAGLARLVQAVDAALGTDAGTVGAGTGPGRTAADMTTAGLAAAAASFPGVASSTAAPRMSPDLPGMGAAGGTAYALAAICGAHLLPGAALVCDLVGLDAVLTGAALVLTGEGRLDASTAEGKAPAEVAKRAAAAAVPCVALAGSVERPPNSIYTAAIPISDGLPLPEAQARTAELLRASTALVVRRLLLDS